jgi:LacI family gluconate utilization system Gnt-I transcriptional repressor
MKKVAPRNPTLGDVAALAQVSTATISRFLNSPDVVAPETGKRIARAIAATGYIPNLLAGGLASRKSKMVAVLIPHLAHSIFNDMIETMAEELARGGTTVMMALTGGEEERTDAMIQAAIGRRVDAIISTAPVSERRWRCCGGFRACSSRSGTCPKGRWGWRWGFRIARWGAMWRDS